MPSINIDVTITKNPNKTYSWSYESEHEKFNSETGEIQLTDKGETTITYKVTNCEYRLIYVNLDPYICATRQIRNIAIDPDGKFITITDANAIGSLTNTTPFSLSLIARVPGDLGAPIVSPDPEVINNPTGSSQVT